MDQQHKTVEFDGFTWHLRLPSNVDNEIAAGRYYDLDMVAWCKQYIKPGMVVADIGANFGCFTLPMSRMVGPTGKVVAVEPEYGFMRRLLKHVRENACDNVTLWPFALMEKAGIAWITPEGPPYHSSATVCWWCCEEDDDYCISCTTFDSAWRHDRLDFVKIDVDFTEHHVLPGMVGSIETFHPVIVIELTLGEPGCLAADTLLRCGYELQTCKQQHITVDTIEAMDNSKACTINVLAVHKQGKP